MKPLRRIGVLVVAAALVVASCASDEVTSNTTTPPDGTDLASEATPEWLFAVQSDGETTFDAATGRLSMPAGSVQAFTDRPHRDTRATSPQSFVNLWRTADPDSFADDPPNAVLTYWETEGTSVVPKTVVCEIVGDVSYSNADRRLSMVLRILDPAGATLAARLERASLFVDSVTQGCAASDTDESNVEYFNMASFNESFGIVLDVDDTTGEYIVYPICPERESTTIPDATFDFRLATADGSQSVSCYSTARITLPMQGLTSLPFCGADRYCGFSVTGVNVETGVVYSQTGVQIAFTGGDTTVLPELNPATLPACSDTTTSTLDLGTLQLESPGTSSP